MNCLWHICTNTLRDKQQKYCGDKCKNKAAVDRKRKKLKLLAIEYKGNKCEKCNYFKNIWALEFHHTNAKEKDFSISDGNTRSWGKVKIELDKCILVCANCHRETHNPL